MRLQSRTRSAASKDCSSKGGAALGRSQMSVRESSALQTAQYCAWAKGDPSPSVRRTELRSGADGHCLRLPSWTVCDHVGGYHRCLDTLPACPPPITHLCDTRYTMHDALARETRPPLHAQQSLFAVSSEKPPPNPPGVEVEVEEHDDNSSGGSTFPLVLNSHTSF